jgi:hypothetical protein
MLVLGGELRWLDPFRLRAALFDLERARERDLFVIVVAEVSVVVLSMSVDTTLSVSEDSPYLLSRPRDRAVREVARRSGVARCGSLLACRRGLPPATRFWPLPRLTLRSRRPVDSARSEGPRLRLRLRLRVSAAVRIDCSICAPTERSRRLLGPLSRSYTPLALLDLRPPG